MLAVFLAATVIVTNVMRNLSSTDCRKDRMDLITLEAACVRYAGLHAGAKPASLDELVIADSSGLTILRGSQLPLDPWERPYRYEPPGAEFAFERIWTFGRDGLPGGDGDDADVGNWMIR